MKEYVIEKNLFLKKNVSAFFHTDYTGYKEIKNPDYLNVLKNTFDNDSDENLENAYKCLKDILRQELPKIFKIYDKDNLKVCVVPRAKSIEKYSNRQLLFLKAVKDVVDEYNFFQDGTNCIERYIDTKTTHLSKSKKINNNGEMPYPGITKDTCKISSSVQGKDILLIDDIYTKEVNIDEDAIQSLLDMGAKSIIFYSVGKTVK